MHGVTMKTLLYLTDVVALGIQHPLLMAIAAEVIYIVPHFHLSLKWLNQC